MTRRIALAVLLLAAQLAGAYLTAPAMAAQVKGGYDVRLDTPSGLPVPRYASLKSDKTYCRGGPSFDHPVRVTFVKKGLPVLIIAETSDYWRKIRDPEGDECWIHKTKLSGVETALVVIDGLALRTRPRPDAPARARLGRGLIARIETERAGWLKVSTGGVTGWARQSGFWTAAALAFAAPQN